MSSNYMDNVMDFLNKYYIFREFGSCIAILIIGLILIKVLLKVIYHLLEKSSCDPVLYKFAIKTVSIIAFTILIIILMENLGIPTKSFLTLMGLTGAAVALALKDSLGNVAGGLFLIITKPFKKDDYVDIDGITGIVQHVDILTTTLYTFDNKVIRFPNGKASTAIIINHSELDTRRVDCQFGISYVDDVDKARQLMIGVCEGNPSILKDPEVFVGVNHNADSAVVIDLKVWTKMEEYWDVKYYLEEVVKNELQKNGITIPYKQLDVHIVKEDI